MAKTTRLRDWTKAIRDDVVHGDPPRSDVDWGEPDGIPTVYAKTYVGLVRVVGYVQYRTEHRVLMRGQTACYGVMKPSAYRGAGAREVDPALETMLEGFRAASSLDRRPRHEPSTEPFLQHYGIRTRWLDLVDNLLHALFFAAYEQVRTDDGTWQHRPATSERSYIYLVDCGSERDIHPVQVVEKRRVVGVSGVWEGSDGFQLCDLRRAKPSKVLRPHVQHGYLCRPGERQSDLWDRVLARVELATADALRWLGEGAAVLPAMLFPGPRADQAFAKLLEPGVEAFFAHEVAAGRDFGAVARYRNG